MYKGEGLLFTPSNIKNSTKVVMPMGKISLILKDGRQARERLSWMSGEELAERLRKDYARGYVSQLREALPRLLPIAQFIHINKIHTVYPSVESSVVYLRQYSKYSSP